ncbi:hypothetical protein OH786_30205 [Streptomyces atratus]|uniref:sortase-dependent protein n=1 Tax=Streptomyces atratus TaxID=1893 RepID=UPI003251B94C
MPHRLSLRTAVLAAVAAGAVLVPSTAAFADSTPAPKPSVERSAAAAPAGVTGPPARGSEPSVAPRGGVAAGERPAGTSSSSTTALAGSAAAALLVAGAGTVVLRRRSAAQRNG